MRTYLATLHKRPARHKKHFALLTSAAITLTIFTIWSVINFGQGSQPTVATDTSTQEVSPFASLRDGVAAVVQSLGGSNTQQAPALEQVQTYGR